MRPQEFQYCPICCECRYSRSNIPRELFKRDQWLEFVLNKSPNGILLLNPNAHLVISIEGRMSELKVAPV
jgi:hypothetical protein